MAASKFNLKEATEAYIFTTAISIPLGGAIAYLIGIATEMRDHYIVTIVLCWLGIAGWASAKTAREMLLRALGYRDAPKLSVSSGSSGRKVPINYASGTKHTYLSDIAALWKPQEQVTFDPPALPMTFTVLVDGLDHTVTLDEIDYFIRKVWALQRLGKNGLSRKYWTRTHKPALDRLHYDTRVNLLLMAGIIVDRGDKRSGRLAVPPNKALDAIKAMS